MNHFNGKSPALSIAGVSRQAQAGHRDDTADVDTRGASDVEARGLPAVLRLHRTDGVRWPEDHASDLDRMTLALTTARQAERQRLVRVLNNIVTPSIFAARLRLSEVAQSTTDTTAGNALREIEGGLAASMKAARDMMADLNSFIADEHGLHALDGCAAQSNHPGDRAAPDQQCLRAALISIGQQFMRRHGVKVHIAGAYSIEPRADVRFELLRAIRQLLMNSVRFSGASDARIRLGNDHRWLRIQVCDEGIAANDLTECAAAECGFGLREIHARLAAMGGRVAVSSADGRGTTVTMLVPLTTACTIVRRAPGTTPRM